MSCPEFLELIDFLDGRLDKDAALRVGQHLATGCPKCAAERAWHLRFRSIGRTDSRYSPPPWAWKRAMQLFEEEQKRNAPDSMRQCEIAILSYDSFTQAAHAGVRSSADNQRQLLYTAEGYTIDLQIAPAEPSGAEVVGQVLRDGDSGFTSVSEILIDLNTHEDTAWSTVTNDVGEFMIIGVDFGDYDLLVDAPEKQIRLPDVPVSVEE
ncbi:MAG TPA: hypothetical protein VFV34_07015 [Blastocatellia bacterium]|nr:hypothetical protein [Blastocatellia bacterium]